MKTVLIIYCAISLLFISIFAQAQYVTITGFVTNTENGEALKNVNVFERNSSIGTITNETGYFKLQLNKGDVDIKISDNGFREFSQSFTLKNDTSITVRLNPILSRKEKLKIDEVQASAENRGRGFFNLSSKLNHR